MAIIDNKKNLVVDVAYLIDPTSTLSPLRLDNLKVESINCEVDEKEEARLINKPLNVLSNTKIKLNFETMENTTCSNINIIDKKLNQSYLVKIDQLNSFHTIDKFKKDKEKNYLNFFKEKNKNLYLKNNTVEINKNLLIPSNLTVVIKLKR